MSEAEMAMLLRTMLPLLRLPSQLGEANFTLCVDSAADMRAETDGEVIGARIDAGLVLADSDAVAVADAWLRGTVTDWLNLLFDRGECRLLLGGAPDLAEACAGAFRGAFSAQEREEPALA